MTREDALAFLARYAKQRYTKADAVLLCGSTAADLGTATSDLDLVVLFERLPGGAYRETVDAEGTLVEAFCHDPGTIRYFIEVQGTPSGVPILAAMVSEGIPVPGFSGSLIDEAKQIADAAISAGPPALTPSEIDHQRYTLASLVDDIDPMQPVSERVAIGSALYLGIATFALRAAGQWSGNGKGLARALARHDPGLDRALAVAIAELVADGDTAKISAVVDAVLTPYGGRLVAGYTARAPAEWRVGN
jgi:predicted nucleotidyltransferase